MLGITIQTAFGRVRNVLTLRAFVPRVRADVFAAKVIGVWEVFSASIYSYISVAVRCVSVSDTAINQMTPVALKPLVSLFLFLRSPLSLTSSLLACVFRSLSTFANSQQLAAILIKPRKGRPRESGVVSRIRQSTRRIHPRSESIASARGAGEFIIRRNRTAHPHTSLYQHSDVSITEHLKK